MKLKKNKFIFFIIILILVFLSGIFVDRYYLLEQGISLEETKKEDTKWKDENLKSKLSKRKTSDINTPLSTKDTDYIVDCYISDLDSDEYIEDDFLYVTVFDACKSISLKYKISSRDTRYHIIQVGVIYQAELKFSYKLSYLYDFKLIAIGGGIIVNKNIPPAYEMLVQIRI